jgi:predicted secreted protein
MAFIKGKDCVISSTTSSTVINVKDVTLNITADTMEASTRNTSGWKEMCPALKSAEVSFDMIMDTTDTAMAALRAAFLADTELTLTITEGGTAWSGTGYLTEFSTSEPLNDYVTISCKIVGSGAWSCA